MSLPKPIRCTHDEYKRHPYMFYCNHCQVRFSKTIKKCPICRKRLNLLDNRKQKEVGTSNRFQQSEPTSQ